MPKSDVLELYTLTFGDEGDEALGIGETRVLGLDDVLADLDAVAITNDLDGDVVPGFGVQRGFQFGEFLGLGRLGDAAHVGNPDGVLTDEGAGEVVMRLDGVTAAEGDVFGSAETKLCGDDEVRGLDGIGAGAGVLIFGHFIAMQRTIGDPPFADGCAPAENGLLASLRRVLAKAAGDDESVRLAKDGLGWLRGDDLTAENAEDRG
jgi:hypothetical protein